MRRLVATLSVIVLLQLFIPSSALGRVVYGMDYGDTHLVWSETEVTYANQAWWTLGYDYRQYLGTAYTRDRVLYNLDRGFPGFYATGHGGYDIPNHTIYFVDYAGYGIWDSDISADRNGTWYELVFIDTCENADTSSMATAFGIGAAGESHTFVGWKGYSYDSMEYAAFDSEFWYRVKTRRTIQYALECATAVTGIQPAPINYDPHHPENSGWALYGSANNHF